MLIIMEKKNLLLKCLLRAIAVLTMLTSLAAPSLSAANRPPNIVFMFADDLGYGDLSSYGHPYAKTPNLDKLASEGTSFMQHYVTGVTCNPSRTGLMTGIHPARFQKYAADYGFGDRPTITSLLKQRGYVTGHFGKWHIGPKSSQVNGMYGIDSVNVIGGDKDDLEGRDAMLFKAAVDFMKENADKPFYVNIWGHSTHFPVTVPRELASKFIEQKVRRSDFSQSMQQKFDECLEIGGQLDACMHQYLADVWTIDLNVGRVMKTIDELGLREDTILVFSSDHGPAPVKLSKGTRQYSENMLGYAGIFRGSKHNQLEGGVRVPFIIRWPGKIKADHKDTESVTSFIDWLPTLASIAGVRNLPNDLDGENISDIWAGNSRDRKSPLFWKVSNVNGASSMRYEDWKLHMPRNRNSGSPELYDLTTDPTESKNLAESRPELLAKLIAMVNDWESELPKSYLKRKNKQQKKEKFRSAR